MKKKYMLNILEKERAFFRYNGKCYEGCSEDRLNYLCQSELGSYRELFTPATKANFIHFAIGSDLVDAEKEFEDQVRYLTMQNGLYDLHEGKLVLHRLIVIKQVAIWGKKVFQLYVYQDIIGEI
jgi:putative DNA primase/helicase